MAGHLDWLLRRARASGIRHTKNIDVPKENFGIRPAIVMDPLDRLLYQSLVDASSRKLIGSLPEWVYGWRLPRKRGTRKTYARQNLEWSLYRRHLKNASIFDLYGLKTDIVSCFASIPMTRLCEYLEKCSATTAKIVTERLTDMLFAFDKVPERSGLPQRSTGSAVLANMYLKQIDPILLEYASETEWERKGPFARFYETSVARWMDDIWAFGNDEGRLRSFQVDLQQALRGVGLEINLGKTAIYGDDDLWSAVNKIEHSAVDAAIESDPIDIEPLEQLIDRLLEVPEKADRTSIRFATTRIREQRLKFRRLRKRIDRLVDAAPRMPHGADHLARVFSDSRIWRKRDDWFLDYAASPWGQMSWSVAQIGTMFPTNTRPPRKVIDKFTEFLTPESEFPIFALSAQRLSSWTPNQIAELLWDLKDRISGPQERRIISLAAAQAGLGKEFIRGVLSEFEENQLTLAMLEERDFVALPPVPDFSPDSDNQA
jgi:hypothetical protein